MGLCLYLIFQLLAREQKSCSWFKEWHWSFTIKSDVHRFLKLFLWVGESFLFLASYHEKRLNFSNALPAYIEPLWFFFVNMVNDIDWFWMSNQMYSCHKNYLIIVFSYLLCVYFALVFPHSSTESLCHCF
jgi:hypothetical protein